MNIKDPDNTNKIINNYINKKINISSTDKDNINQLKKFSNFLEKYEFIPTPDICLELIKSNKILSSILKKIIENNLNIIKNHGINALETDEIIIMLLEVYCTLNNITYQKEEENEELEFEYDTSAMDSLGAYLLEIRQPLLTLEEERDLAIKASHGNKYARETLIERNLRWVVRIARTYQNRGLDLGELIQEGNIGLITAVDKYDYTTGYRLTTYSSWWIRQAITRAIHDKGRAIRVPVHIHEKLIKIKSASTKLEKELYREPTIEELAEELKMSVDSIKEIMPYQKDIVSLNTTIGDEEETELEHFVPSNEDTPEDSYAKKVLPEEIHNFLIRSSLTDREINILLLRHGFIGNPKTLEEVGQIYGVTRERIRQVENEALKKIRRSSNIKSLAEWTSNPSESLKNIGVFREFYNTFNNQSSTNKSLQKKGSTVEITKQLENIPKETKQQETITKPVVVPTENAVPKKAEFTIFEKFLELGYTKDEVREVIKELPNLDRKRVLLRNGRDLDNPVISPNITERDRYLYIKRTIPKIEELLTLKYGYREPPKIKVETTIFDEMAIHGYTKEETLSVLSEINNNDKKRLELMNGAYLDNPVREQNISPKSIECYEKFTIPNIKKLLEKKYGKRNNSPNNKKRRLTIYEFTEKHGYTKEQTTNIILSLTEQEQELIKLKNGAYLDNPVYNSNTTTRENDKYSKLKRKILKKLKEKYNPEIVSEVLSETEISNSQKNNTDVKEGIIEISTAEVKQITQSNEIKMVSNTIEEENKMKRMTVFEYFALNGYSKEEVKEIIRVLTLKEQELIKIRNGEDLDNPTYNPTVTQSQRVGYTKVLKKMLKLLIEKYGKREGTPEIQSTDNIETKPEEVFEEHENSPEETDQPVQETVQEEEEKAINETDENLNQEIQPQNEQKIKENPKKKKGKQRKSIIQKFEELGYTKEEIEHAINELSERDLEIIKIMDGEDLENPIKSQNATKKDESIYYQTVIPRIKRTLKNVYGDRMTKQQPSEEEVASEQENKEDSKEKVTQFETPLITDTDIKLSLEKESNDPIAKSLMNVFKDESSNLQPTIAESPVSPVKEETAQQQESVTVTEESSTSVNSMTKDDYIKILELLKTPTFYELMTKLPVKKAIIIALRLGYIDGKYFSTESIATFLGIEKDEVRETTTEILNLHKQNINNMIDTATAYLNETRYTRKLEQ